MKNKEKKVSDNLVATQKNIVVCDNTECDFVIPNHAIGKPLTHPKTMSLFIDQCCPKCASNLLTYKDYVKYEREYFTIEKIQKIYNKIPNLFKPKIEQYKKIEGFNIPLKIHTLVFLDEFKNEGTQIVQGETVDGKKEIYICQMSTEKFYLIDEKNDSVSENVSVNLVKPISKTDNSLYPVFVKVLQPSDRKDIFELSIQSVGTKIFSNLIIKHNYTDFEQFSINILYPIRHIRYIFRHISTQGYGWCKNSDLEPSPNIFHVGVDTNMEPFIYVRFYVRFYGMVYYKIDRKSDVSKKHKLIKIEKPLYTKSVYNPHMSLEIDKNDNTAVFVVTKSKSGNNLVAEPYNKILSKV